MTMEYDKINGDVGFIDSTHEYSNIKNPDIKYTSVTTLIHNYTQPFDGEFWSGYKAIQSIVDEDAWKLIKKDLLATKKINDSLLESFKISKEEFEAAKQEILDTWEEKKNTACERGTAIHAQFENGFYESGSATKLNKYGIGGTFTCDKGRTALDLEKGVYPEYLIYRESDDGILKIAGQIDCLVKDGNEITIVDFKTNAKIDRKSGFDVTTKKNAKMLYPLNNLDDCNFYHYTMQLSTYALMLQLLNPEFIIKDLILYHINHDDEVEIIKCDYLKEEVIRMLSDYKKKIKNKQFKKKTAKIVY